MTEAATGRLFAAGSLVAARGREWVVLPESAADFLVLRPLGGSDDDVAGVFPELERVTSASFPLPVASDLGDHLSAAMLRSALQIGFRASAGPFRSLARIGVEPRSYQLVPLMMALRQDVVRLLIADDVGIGKTIEAGLVAAELLSTGDANGLVVLCSPALAEQWQRELREKFGLEAELVLTGTVARLQRNLVGTETVFERYPYTVVSTDFIKAPGRRDEFVRSCPDLVIVDEAHTCVTSAGRGGRARTQRYELVRRLADESRRHLVLATATPHSGDEEAFRNLLGLLHPDLATIDLDQVDGRERLARHFVQRRRGDIRHYLDQDTPFPSDRQTKESPYALTPTFADVMADAIQVARAMVRTDEGTLARRVTWWSALAMLRALASSPRAAMQTLRTRSAVGAVESAAEADALGRATVLDYADDEAVESPDATPGAVDDEAADPHRRQLRDLLRRVEALSPADDAKLAEVTKVVRALLADGFHPIVFCRFIDTAEYVAEHLDKALGSRAVVRAVTGTLPPAERMVRVDELASSDGYRVLVATDCLSEGVNLQDGFQAVVHYDLAWNPTRHEQREGRVDRFGQTADVVRAVTMYGIDNHVDAVVLNVLLRKHEQIRKATGVSVPVPDDSDAVVEALMESLLLRNRDPEQLMLDVELEVKREALYATWESAAERERQSQTKYAQRGIQPAQVAAEVAEIRAGLGGTADVAAFTEMSLRSLGSVVHILPNGFSASLAPLPLGLRDALPPDRPDPLRFARDLPVRRGEAVLHRTDASVEAVAEYVLQAALDAALETELRPARRCGVTRTAAVSTRTTLLLVRYRFHLTLPARSGERSQVAEQAALIAFESAPEQARWLDSSAATALLVAEPTGNVAAAHAVRLMSAVVDGVASLQPHLDAYGDDLAARLAASHQRVREVAGEVRRGLAVRAERPADLLGVYVFLPESGAPR